MKLCVWLNLFISAFWSSVTVTVALCIQLHCRLSAPDTHCYPALCFQRCSSEIPSLPKHRLSLLISRTCESFWFHYCYQLAKSARIKMFKRKNVHNVIYNTVTEISQQFSALLCLKIVHYWELFSSIMFTSFHPLAPNTVLQHFCQGTDQMLSKRTVWRH